MSGTVSVSVDNLTATAVVTLSNVERRNAIGAGMWRDLLDFANSCAGRPDIRSVVFRGEGKVFSAGADISEFSSGRSDISGAKAFDDLVESACAAIESIPQPTVASIEGPCIGAGASLASSCDLRVASVDTVFAVPAAKLGLGYDIRGISRFLRVFGTGATAEVLLTAGKLASERAFTLGAVHRLCAPGSAQVAALELAIQMGANAPLTLAAAKTAIRALAGGDAQLARIAVAMADIADGSADYSEGRAAFAEKRPPTFQGK
ncbi:enoyl-CoA hydratase/isomerase family protein [Rhizobium sp. VS19-DR104.2]|uniref:enoyl-CoA hydratase-related protein n=1 Tax=unclassified Rhizobium TaxID=2613769 RepID=UPI001CC487A7|nr:MULTISPECIES: enoyl-CoA hydratase-related protein [unclassified Rhizobium]MBZ5762234.1 enoyl-CoA hydratase/isomerase family protein [Rhizobium sp. VS19-DR96]MBZ5768250.1 enoyl-CoA hydratase/isomerase family protein [Rhizobium sp. VS19-DR129.2]MBZ5775878.1 enoyl-CoA hydratase/isomerase family protein [Rhizobium sp. VS19-DRK62.2]MBZ5787101.1 enoyl-CoA hydratase/isomerase family protein [Rhizobium sp. VS19-DR121]MBZ5804175.1 enoyl-CoA hydratase/isomerase family protein [Rhizobium sp. VS19-DR18